MTGGAHTGLSGMVCKKINISAMCRLTRVVPPANARKSYDREADALSANERSTQCNLRSLTLPTERLCLPAVNCFNNLWGRARVAGWD